MRALLVRHAQSVGNADPPAVLSDKHGDQLTDLGREQADALGRSLEGGGVTDLITSSMTRARETAEVIGAHLGLEAEVDEEIHELRSTPEIEPFEEVRGRARALLARLAADYGDRTPLVVTHGIFLRIVLMEALLGEMFVAEMVEQLWNLRTANCGVSVFEYGERYDVLNPEQPSWVCSSWMERPWAAPATPAPR
jgi:broad specificity phosphatase PhoE